MIFCAEREDKVSLASPVDIGSSYTAYSAPGSDFGAPPPYGAPPAPAYGSPPTNYGPPSYPSSSYGPPSASYGPPSFSYGPPSSYSYGPPTHYGPPKPIFHHYGPPHPIVISAPREENWLLDKFKFKLDLFTIGKILIKLIIFKKIIKFIALICLLLFLPKLQPKSIVNMSDLLGIGDSSESEESDERRAFGSYCK